MAGLFPQFSFLREPLSRVFNYEQYSAKSTLIGRTQSAEEFTNQLIHVGETGTFMSKFGR